MQFLTFHSTSTAKTHYFLVSAPLDWGVHDMADRILDLWFYPGRRKQTGAQFIFRIGSA